MRAEFHKGLQSVVLTAQTDTEGLHTELTNTLKYKSSCQGTHLPQKIFLRNVNAEMTVWKKQTRWGTLLTR
ncbi:hypothetical protein BaRGS_00019723 [Batillaria attramentaria]|uniref:Uncharacterized protein n=1 Tax=Batillaria attramentaria TaxID=370345 RepID=A0ABD0KPD9_9CAEN